MNTTMNHRFKRYRHRGSIMLLVIAALLLMMILGLSFIEVARQDRNSTTAISVVQDADNVTKTVAARIKKQLKDDLKEIYNGEPHDYPHEQVDRWLANTAPTVDVDGSVTGAAGNLYWRHISNLFGNLAAADVENVVAQDISIAYDTSTGEPLDSQSGAGRFADADGDGVLDARWIHGVVPGHKVAVRIIDNSSWPNLNMASALSSDGSTGFPSSSPGNDESIRGYWPNSIDLSRLMARTSGDDGSGSVLTPVPNWKSEMEELLRFRRMEPDAPTPITPSALGLNLMNNPTGASGTDPGTKASHWFLHGRFYSATSLDERLSISNELELRFRGGLNNLEITANVENGMPQLMRHRQPPNRKNLQGRRRHRSVRSVQRPDRIFRGRQSGRHLPAHRAVASVSGHPSHGDHLFRPRSVH